MLLSRAIDGYLLTSQSENKTVRPIRACRQSESNHQKNSGDDDVPGTHVFLLPGG